MRLKDKCAVITAAGSGMGRAAAELFAREGATVCVVDYSEKNARAAVDAITEAGGKAHALVADLMSEDACRQIVHDSAKLMGGIDIFWAHAGEPGPSGIEKLDMAAYQHAIDLNVRSAVVSTGEVIPYMRERRGGAILYTASISGLVGSQFSPIYSMAKFGMVGLTKSLSLSLGPDRIRVNIVCPGLVDTPMLPDFLSRGGDPAVAEANLARFVASIPLGRVAQPQEVAKAALWLCSDDASYVTGVALPVDGGFTCR
ncbi:MAG: glucose 1-dehydrogenase [Comamonadaceae bacterium]|nr:MAG: glucose 1-dehydrogenase [Comamonadaceae bacterium]